MKIAWIARTKYQKLISKFSRSSKHTVHKVSVHDDYSDQDIVVSFGDTPVNISDGQSWIHLDGAYFGRPNYFRVTKNAFYPWDYFMDIQRPGDRWTNLNVDIQDWKYNPDGHILICKISDRSAAFLGSDINADIKHFKQIISKQSDRVIITRDKAERYVEPLKKAMEGCFSVVTWWSTAGVDALVAGYPVFLLSRSVCESLAGNIFKINEPRRPPREQWLHNLAYQQWTREEIKDGTAWKFIMEGDI